MRYLVVAFFGCVVVLLVSAQEPLTNATIQKLIKAGVSADTVVILVNSQSGVYAVTPAAIIKLKKAHVPDRVIQVMIARGTSAKPSDAQSKTATPTTASPLASASDRTNSSTTAGATEVNVAGPSTGEPTVNLAGGHIAKISDLTTAFIGTGWLLTAHGTDYKVLQSTNVLEATGLGHKTPDFLLGAAFNTRLRPWFWRAPYLISNLNDPHVDAFVSLKFTPGSQNTINGFVFGGALRIHPNLDLVVGVALTPQNAPAIGLRQAAFLAASADPATYAGFNPRDLLLNKEQAFDGFPLLNPATGKPLYAGEPLTAQYRNGLFIGIAFPVSLSGLFKSTTQSTDNTPKPAEP